MCLDKSDWLTGSHQDNGKFRYTKVELQDLELYTVGHEKKLNLQDKFITRQSLGLSVSYDA